MNSQEQYKFLDNMLLNKKLNQIKKVKSAN